MFLKGAEKQDLGNRLSKDHVHEPPGPTGTANLVRSQRRVSPHLSPPTTCSHAGLGPAADCSAALRHVTGHVWSCPTYVSSFHTSS